MSATASASASAPTPLPEPLQAAALWTFVQLKVPRFTSEVALEVVRNLAITPSEDVKSLASRLQREMAVHGVAMKRTAALEAAARLLGHRDWHTANREFPRLALNLNVFGVPKDRQFGSWKELAPVVLGYAKAWLQQSRTEWPVFRLEHAPGILSLWAPAPNPTRPHDTVPFLSIRALEPTKGWLETAPAAFEFVRRGLEETSLAVLDGLTVLQLCGQYSAEVLARLPQFPRPVDTRDVCDSELVLLREDNELMPGSGYEIARGDEMNCWYQLELAARDHASMEITLDEGAWRIGKGRYVWQMNSVQPAKFAPMLHVTLLSETASERLFRRYRLAKRTFSGHLRHPEAPKRLTYLSGPGSTYHVDQHRILVALERAGMTWESFCEAEGLDQARGGEVQVGFLMQLVERLKPENPNQFFARPNRSEMARADDDSVLRTLAPRTDYVTYRLARGASDEVKSAVRDAVEEFASSQHVRRLSEAGVVQSEDPLPYLVYGIDARELLDALNNQGLVLYVGVMPWLMAIDRAQLKLPENSWSYAMGHQLYLDIDFAEPVE